MKAVVAAFNQEKALVGAFSVITNLRMDLFEALVRMLLVSGTSRGEACAEQASSSFVNGLCCDWCQLMFYDAAITATHSYQ